MAESSDEDFGSNWDAALGVSIAWRRKSATIAAAQWRCDAKPAEPARERSQPWFGFGFVHSGGYELRDSRGETLIESTRVDFFSAGAPYRTSHPVGFHDRGAFFAIRQDVAVELIRTHDPLQRDCSDPVFRVQQSPISGSSYLEHRRLLLHADEGAMDPLQWEEAALGFADRVIGRALLGEAGRSAPAKRHRFRGKEAVAAAKGYLAARFAEVRRLGDIARATGLSPYHLCRAFKAETGLSMHAYRNRLRLRAALDRLPARRHDLASLALELGYASHSHFTENFRREFGVAPSRVARTRGIAR